MSSTPLLASTLGFISAISKTILAIASIGLLDVATSTGGNGGGSGTAGGQKQIPWGDRQPEYDIYKMKHPTIDVSIYAAAVGMI